MRDLKLAVITSQHRSLRQAAEAINIRQSTLSRRLRELEDRLGAVLFERTNGGTRPTVAGLEFVEQARRILEETEMALRNLKTRTGDDPACDVARRQRVPLRASASPDAENSLSFAPGRTDKRRMSTHPTADLGTSWTPISCFEAPTHESNRG
jgi:DNA-binding transcriptional LysR family regulator